MRRAFMWPNAQVQGRPLGAAEANSGGGVPCNAQLGWWPMRIPDACIASLEQFINAIRASAHGRVMAVNNHRVLGQFVVANPVLRESALLFCE